MEKSLKTSPAPKSLTEFLLAEEDGFVFFNEENGDLFTYEKGEITVLRSEEKFNG